MRLSNLRIPQFEAKFASFTAIQKAEIKVANDIYRNVECKLKTAMCSIS